MSRYERHGGTRDLTFSRWHRQALPATCGMIDVDCLEYCARCRMPLFLVETARDIAQARKVTAVLERLAMQSNIPAYCVLYTPNGEDCPYDRKCRTSGCGHGISHFRIRQVSPKFTEWTYRSSADFTAFVLSFHDMHERMVCRSSWLAGEGTPA